MDVNNFLTHIDNAEDVAYLKTPLLDVNMRLFAANANYRRIIQGICNYLSKVALTEMQGYKKPHGMSGANIGIPLNIIGIIRKRDTAQEYCEVMINPKIIKRSAEVTQSLSNCGSIRLPEPIPVLRNNFIKLEWFDIDGNPSTANFTRESAGFTIQHEVDHNQGILITDRAKEVGPF